MFERIVMNYVDALLLGYEGVLDGHVGSFLRRDLRHCFSFCSSKKLDTLTHIISIVKFSIYAFR